MIPKAVEIANDVQRMLSYRGVRKYAVFGITDEGDYFVRSSHWLTNEEMKAATDLVRALWNTENAEAPKPPTD